MDSGLFIDCYKGCFTLDKYVTISCIVYKNLDKKIYILSKNSLEKVVKSKYTIIKELILLC